MFVDRCAALFVVDCVGMFAFPNFAARQRWHPQNLSLAHLALPLRKFCVKFLDPSNQTIKIIAMGKIPRTQLIELRDDCAAQTETA